MAFTFFLRDMQTLERVVEHVIPYTSGRSRVRVWDAGCATGQEPYSLAMLFAENMGTFGFKNLRIEATDLDDCSLFGDIIRTGAYREEEVKRMPGDLLAKYFTPDDRPGYFSIAELLRNRIQYQRHDLLTLKPIGEGFSLILCKNVLLHFENAQRIKVIEMFHRSLAPGGFFATEQTQKMPAEISELFEPVASDAQLFRKLDVIESR
ncbi:MAG: CheR family methyltransferase [Syntrophobacteraceae bacterium]|nr:CheR family methyltransferase [Syntrophobacteraceae bacterium]